MSVKESLKIAIDNFYLFEETDSYGLCNYFISLVARGKINQQHKVYLNDYINKHRPFLNIALGFKGTTYTLNNSKWFFATKDASVRLKYLKLLYSKCNE
jgi:hypothetical protein